MTSAASRALLGALLAVIFTVCLQAQQQAPGRAEPTQTPKGDEAPGQPQDEHAGHVMPVQHASPGTPIPPLTAEDRAAAFPDVEGHTVHDRAIHYFVLFDQLEWRPSGSGDVSWDSKGWIGRDVNRMWFRTEGEATQNEVERVETHFLYGRAIARWWDLVAGIRQDFRPGPGRTYAAFGVQGLAPYWFEVEATGYIGEGGRTHARLEAEYDLLLTNRLIAQPLVEIELYGQKDIERGIGAGLSSTGLGARFRYELRRELAPYVGVTWDRLYGATRELAISTGKDGGAARVTFGVRAWF